MRAEAIIDQLMELVPSVRYAALFPGRGEPVMRRKDGHDDASSAESQRYQELLANPALIAMARQRGNIDCGGLEYLVVRYVNGAQLIVPIDYGHVTVGFDDGADPIAHVQNVKAILMQHGAMGRRAPTVPPPVK